jgi:hypothetical protein
MQFKAVDCSEENYLSLPDMQFSFYDVDSDFIMKKSRATLDLTIEPKDYMVTTDKDKQGNSCVPGFMDHGTEYGWTFGIGFLKTFIMVYDIYNEKVGFVRSNNDI